MAVIAKIAVASATYAIDRPYDYLVPEALIPTLMAGMRVAVPFGQGNRVSDGIVLSCSEQDIPEDKVLKYILTQLDEEPLLDQGFIQLALWMRERYFCTVYDAARIMLPAGLWFSLKDCWKFSPGVDREAAYEAAGQSKRAVHLIELMLANDGWAELGQIKLAFGTTDPNPAIKLLMEKGIIVQESSAVRGIGEKTEQIAELAIPPEEALAFIAPKRHRAPLQYSVVETLCAVGEAATKELYYFTGASSTTMRALQKAGVITLSKREICKQMDYTQVKPASPIQLNAEQQKACDELLALCKENAAAVSLLYGVTGSGKTQVYIELIKRILEENKSVIILVPEISLTPQLMEKFIAHFGQRVAIMHSSLTSRERYEEWKRIRSGNATVVIGTRSAVFAPVQNLGAIILDEEQETSYKSEQNPRYHAREIARYRCSKSGGLLLLGSATPSVDTMYHARKGDYHLHTLGHRFNDQALPEVRIVDLKAELRSGNGSCISGALYTALDETIEKGEQAILLLNRRGASKMVVCGECGEVPTCPRCSVHLTYHSANQRLMCHYCGHSEPLRKECPSCGGILNFVGAGTQKVEEELNTRFPNAEILRMDADTISATNSHEKILSRFKNEKIPILLGTQMIAKGLDFENVTLVGVVSADQSLYSDDFHAGERTFSLLTQVVGRAGRGRKAGQAIIQTHTPENDLICSAAKQDYDEFYMQEIRMRQLRNYPPFQDLLMISVSGLQETAVLRGCAKLRDAITEALSQPEYASYEHTLLGPAPAAVAKVNNRYRYRLVLSIRNTKETRRLIAHLLRRALSDKENRTVSFSADFIR